jgi:hypothetical protein
MSCVLRYRHAIASVDMALFVGLSTGFCGSLTTFSTWAQRASWLFMQGRVFDGLLVLFLTHACSWLSMSFAEAFLLCDCRAPLSDVAACAQPIAAPALEVAGAGLVGVDADAAPPPPVPPQDHFTTRRHDDRHAALTHATYGPTSAHRRQNTLGLEFMTEVDHLNLVMRHVQALDLQQGSTAAALSLATADHSLTSSPNVSTPIEGYATDATLRAALRSHILRLAELYAEALRAADDKPIAEEGFRERAPPAPPRVVASLFGPWLPAAVGALLLALAAAACAALAWSARPATSETLVALATSPWGALLRSRDASLAWAPFLPQICVASSAFTCTIAEAPNFGVWRCRLSLVKKGTG